MKFTLIEACPKVKGKCLAVNGEKVQVAGWVKRELNPNELGDKIDSFFDGFGDLVRGEDGKLYLAESFCWNEHFGEYGIWCELANQDEEISK